MRKTITGTIAAEKLPSRSDRLDLERVGRVEVSSEEDGYPIESALTDGGAGWRAAVPGEQTIRFVFDQPLALRRIVLKFAETDQARTQEFVLRWLPAGGSAFREIVRQQYTFSPPGTVFETEDYNVQLESVNAVELDIIPDIAGGAAHASLAEMALC
jgi:hypothetical protein